MAPWLLIHLRYLPAQWTLNSDTSPYPCIDLDLIFFLFSYFGEELMNNMKTKCEKL